MEFLIKIETLNLDSIFRGKNFSNNVEINLWIASRNDLREQKKQENRREVELVCVKRT